MAAMRAISERCSGETTVEHALGVCGEFTFQVLDNLGGHQATGWGAKLTGSRFIAEVSELLERDTCVRINCRDGLLLGEIRGCWREGPAIVAAVELLHSLMGLQELASAHEGLGLAKLPAPGIRQKGSNQT